MRSSKPGPGRTARQWALMQRVERCWYRAEQAEARTESGSEALRAEMAELAEEWRGLAREIELEHSASNALIPRAGTGEQQARSDGRRRDFVLGAVIGALGAATVIAPNWIEATIGIDMDRASGALEWVMAAAAILGAIIAWAAVRRRGRRL